MQPDSDTTPPNVNDAAQAEDYFTRRRNWPTYWGGMAEGSGPPLIHAKMRALRIKVGGLAAKKQGGGGPAFPVKSSKELFEKLAEALTDLNMIAPVTGQKVTTIDVERGTACHVEATVRIAAEDGSFIECVGSGHGMDKDDKAGGKASTYAWKDALLKGLTIGEKGLIDTDDEEGVGAEVRPKGRAAAQAAYGLAQAVADIGAAKSRDALIALRDARLKGLPEADQMKASEIYRARLADFPQPVPAANA